MLPPVVENDSLVVVDDALVNVVQACDAVNCQIGLQQPQCVKCVLYTNKDIMMAYREDDYITILKWEKLDVK